VREVFIVPWDRTSNSVHELDETSYKHRFGIPYRCGLVQRYHCKTHAEERTKRISPEERREYVAAARATMRAMADSGSLECRPTVGSVDNQRVQQIKVVNDTEIAHDHVTHAEYWPTVPRAPGVLRSRDDSL
jgi:hypothetical protein